jgi:hypothetical protein
MNSSVEFTPLHRTPIITERHEFRAPAEFKMRPGFPTPSLFPRHSVQEQYLQRMSVEQLEEQIERLPQRDLARLVGWLDHFLDRQAPAEPGESDDLTGNEKAELLRRRDELLAHPDLAQPMDDTYFDGLKRQLADERARKTSGR